MTPNRPKQPTPKDLTDSLLEFLRRKFYEGHSIQFAKDRKRLLAWVVLWPAAWFRKRGVTVPADRYREIFCSVFLDSLDFKAAKVTYFPAWLRQVIQSHFKHNEETIYGQAKSLRNVTEHVLLMAGKSVQGEPDPIDAMAAARDVLLAGSKVKKTVGQPASKQQLDLI